MCLALASSWSMMPALVVNTTKLKNGNKKRRNNQNLIKTAAWRWNKPELARGEDVVGPLVDGIDRDVEAGRNDTALVEATGEVDNNLAVAVVVDDFELLNVSCSCEVSTRHSKEVEKRWKSAPS